ncbi:MAG: hypothetical protein KKA05_08625 [Alphaproteobacteria bacterium]|nr:hypothetical protein [Alphaproteobacteria bacterium]
MGSMSGLNILGAGMQGLGSLVTTALPILNMGSQAVKEIRNFGRDPAEEARENAQRQAAHNLAAQQNLALAQLKAQQQMDEQQAAQDANLARQDIAAEAADADAARRAALKRAVARQKVSMASQGISAADDGSSEAILLGMFQETENDRVTRTRLDGLREQAIGQNLAQKQALNILQRSQLAERQRLERELQE